MKIRRYIANNNQEAILKVKMDLGNDALILNTRKVRQKGIFGLFSKPKVEVLAAIDEYGIRKEPENSGIEEKPPNSAKDTQNKINFDEKEGKITNLENKITNMEDMLQKIYRQIHVKEKLPDPGQKDEKQDQAPRAVQIFYNNLIRNEVESDIARRIIDNVVAKVGDNAGLNDTASVLYSIVAGIVGKPEIIGPLKEGKPTVVIFVGPTGVGKTTTLAKIAANYLLNQKKSVGLITADTYRIAAVEQLKTYAEILGIPVSVVYSVSDMSDAVNQFSDRDIILIDTAGRSHRNKAQFEEMKAMVTASGADEVYLVLSSTTSIRSCREIISNYDFLKDYKLIFTKTDEAPVLGIILNIRFITGMRLSYITTGQNVPDDIEVVNVDKISKSLIGSIV
ncbi:MAG: flagellar biosynthesis protein FlhF [Ruminiclostridium sp.]|nr:flagellar biosynthesis protein FlhF [Ruminiclostridium sp.]